MLLILLIGILFTLTCVNASQPDNATDEVQLDSPDNIPQIDSIKDAIANAKDEDTIYLDNITYDGDDNTQITIDKSINFVGSENTVIDGKSAKSLFVIGDNVRVSFKDIKFINAHKSGKGEDVYGAALEIHNAEVIIDNCQFISNKVSSGLSDDIYGAAISNMGNLTILNSCFLENVLNSGFGHNGFGGSIYNNGHLYVNNSSFIKSRGGEYSKGSAIYNDKVALINNSVIAESYCFEESMGSAIFNNGNLTLLNSRIENNTIERNNFNYIFGNIFNSGLLIAYGNIFKNNTGYYKQPNSGYEGCPTIYNVGDLDVSYNAFIDNIGGFKKIYRDVYLNGGKSVNINNNWWGSNDDPFATQAINVDKVVSWLILDVDPSYSTSNINENVDIVASWKLSNGLDPQFLLPFDIKFSDEFGHTQTNNLKNQDCIFTFNDTQNKGLYTVDVSLYSYKQSVIVDVGKIKTNIEIKSNNNTYSNENLVIDISLYDENSNLINGTVSVSISNQNKIINLVNGKGLATFTDLIPNEYELKIAYEGSEEYFKSFNQTNVIIKKYSINLEVEEIRDIYVNEEFTVNIHLATEEVEGPANLYVNGIFKQGVYLKSGDTIIEFSNFGEGDYNITIELIGNEYYQATNSSTTFKVKRYASQINITSEDIFINNNQTLIITAENDFIGEVILSINNVNYTLFLSNETTYITLTNLSAGVYHVDLIFNGNGKFSPQNASTSFEVKRYPSSLIVTIFDNVINVKTSPVSCTGSVNVYINRRYYQLDLIGGQANFDVEYDEGTNYIYVFYDGDDYFAPSNYNATVGEGKAVAIIGVNVTTYEYQNFNYTVQIYEKNGFAIPYKVIAVKIGSEEYNVTTNSQGVGILPLKLENGYYEVISTYNDLMTTNYLEIKPIEFNLTADNVIFGQKAIIVAEFNESIDGKVNFTISNGLTAILEIIDGKATYAIENLDVGLWDVSAYYTNDLFNSTAESTTFEVEKINPIINLEIKEAFIGQDETIIAKADNLTGNITFAINGNFYDLPIINGEVALVLSNLGGGTHTLEVKYAGDQYHKSVAFAQEFSIKTQRTSIVLSVNETAYGEDIIVVAEVDGDALGNLTFSVNNLKGCSQIKDGIATWSFRGLNVGNYAVKVEYSGDNTFSSATNSTNFKVIKANSTIELYVEEVVLDENIRIYARVSPNATGKVSFSMKDYYSPRDKNIINSTSSWYISPLETGKYIVYATYRGDNNYHPSNTTFILEVSQTRSLLTVEADDITDNEGATITVALISIKKENIDGAVNIQIGTKSYTINVRNGKGTLNLGKLSPGEYTIKATYGGSDKFAGSKASSSFTVYDHLLESFLSCENVVKYYNSPVKFVISLTNAKNKPISGETLYVNVKDIVSTYITDDEGKVYLDINNTFEKYDVCVEFRGSNTYYPSNASGTIEVLPSLESEDVLKVYGSGVQYFAIFKDFNGKALSNTNVTFDIAGKMYAYTTFPNGVVRLNINLDPGTYNITAFNPVTGENITNTLTIYKILMENSDVVNYFGAKSTYAVRVYGNDGKPIGEGAVVTFAVDGKTYHVNTNKDGYAIFSIELNPKQYVITAEFNGTRVSNIITVKPVLTTKITSSKKSKKTKFSAKLLDTNGNPLSGKKITFKIKGKKYKAKTNRKGIASIKIKLKLKRGTYKIYTIYGKSKVINQIKVK